MHTVIFSTLSLFCNAFDRSFLSYFWLTRIYSKGILFITGVRLEVIGAKNVDPDKVYVYVSNHGNMFDIPCIMASAPTNASIVFKKELAKIPFFGWSLATGPYIIVNRQNPEKAMKSIERGKRMMSEKGISVVLFAEGTRSKTDSVQPFKRGAFHLASIVKFPIIPVSVCGAQKIMPNGVFSQRKGTIKIIYGRPIETAHIESRKDEIELMELVREIVIRQKENENESN